MKWHLVISSGVVLLTLVLQCVAGIASPCSSGFLARSPVVFPCVGSGGTVNVDYLALAGSNANTFTIPKGTTDFSVSLVSTPKDDVDLVFYDPASKEYWVRYDVGKINDARLTGTVSGTGVQGDLIISYSGSKPRPEKLKFTGVTPVALDVVVMNHGMFPASVTLQYSFGPVQSCVEPWIQGCKAFNPFEVQDMLIDWSIWAYTKYRTPGKAWEELAGPMTETHQGWPAGTTVVPYFKWSYVWDAWPMAKQKAAGWEDAFHFIAPSGDFADESGFNRAYSMANVSLAVQACFEEFQQKVRGDEKHAWAILSADGGSESFVANCSQLSGIGQHQIQAFIVVANGHGEIGKEEFQHFWNRLRLCPSDAYRSGSIIFGCHEVASFIDVRARAQGTTEVAEIPKGTVNLKLTALSDRRVGIDLWDTETNTWVMQREGGPNGHAEYRGIQYQINRADSRGPIFEEEIRFEGSLPAKLKFSLQSYGSMDATVVVSYSWDKIDDEVCRENIIRGCSKENRAVVDSALDTFSAWLGRDYSSEAEAWEVLQRRYVSSVGVARWFEPFSTGGFRFDAWRQVWEVWPSHRAEHASFAESFHAVDANRDGMINGEEFGKLYRRHHVEQVLRDIFGGFHETGSNLEEAWELASKGGANISSERWETIVVNLVDTQRLPGGTVACKPAPKPRPAVYSKDNLARLGTDGNPWEISAAQDLGLVGNSFTIMAMVRIPEGDLANEASPIIGTPDAKLNHALFAGLRGGRPAINFGSESCMSDTALPRNRWVDVAWIFDLATKEMRIYVGGTTSKVCPHIGPFQGFGAVVWVGLARDASATWSVDAQALKMFPLALPGPELRSIFKYTPKSVVAGVTTISAKNNTVLLGSADSLGLNQRSFTIVGSIFRSKSQGDEYQDVYTIIGVPQDSSFEIVLWNGKLGMSFGGDRCAADNVLTKGKWIDVAFVYDALQKKHSIFQDGRLVKSCVGVEPYNGTEQQVWLGQSGDSIGEWSGSLRNFRIYGYSECTKGIQTLMQGASMEERGNQSTTLHRRLTMDVQTATQMDSRTIEVARDSFEIVDGNGDGMISKSEFAAKMEKITEGATSPSEGSRRDTPSSVTSAPTSAQVVAASTGEGGRSEGRKSHHSVQTPTLEDVASPTSKQQSPASSISAKNPVVQTSDADHSVGHGARQQVQMNMASTSLPPGSVATTTFSSTPGPPSPAPASPHATLKPFYSLPFGGTISVSQGRDKSKSTPNSEDHSMWPEPSARTTTTTANSDKIAARVDAYGAPPPLQEPTPLPMRGIQLYMKTQHPMSGHSTIPGKTHVALMCFFISVTSSFVWWRSRKIRMLASDNSAFFAGPLE